MPLMETIDLRKLDDGKFEIRLGGVPGRITVETMSEALLGLATALEEINRVVNPEYELRVYVDAVTPGSVRFRLSLTKTQIAAIAAGLMTAGVFAKEIVVELLAGYIADAIRKEDVCKVDPAPNGAVTFEADGKCKITLSREAYDRLSEVRSNEKIAEGVNKAMEAVTRDQQVTTLEIAAPDTLRTKLVLDKPEMKLVIENTRKRMSSDNPVRFLERQLSKISARIDIPVVVPEKRTKKIRANLVIIKAVFLRSKRKWQFNWNGIKVSAPINDADFFDQLEAGDIALHQGDALDADLVVHQEYIEGARVWQNRSYEVVKVYSVTLGQNQTTMDF